MGRVSKGVNCSVAGCGNKAVRSISAERAGSAKLTVPEKGRVFLCEDHYKELKKKLKKERMIERWRWSV
jgi:hypothetical protein